MKNFLAKTLITAAAIILSSYVLKAGVKVDRFRTALVLALVLSLLNFFVKPLLIIVTLPVTIVTLGLFLFIINAIIIILASHLVTGFHVESLGWALVFSLLLSLFTYLLESVIQPDYRKKKE
ncbi:MAG: phage holin family protein [Bacteroidetes bacterium]|nr:phage holin family protein [Bacteroidota bacterium]